MRARDAVPLLIREAREASPGRTGPSHRRGRASEQALHVDTRTFNTLLRHVRALGERTAAEFEQRWRALRSVTLSPSRIGDIARAVSSSMESGSDHR